MKTISPNIDQLKGVSHFIDEDSRSVKIRDEDYSFAQELISETGCKDSIDNIAYLIQIARSEKRNADLRAPIKYDEDYLNKLEITPHQRAMLDMEYDELNRAKSGFHKDQETYSKLFKRAKKIETTDKAYFQKIRITLNESNHFTFIEPSLISEIMAIINKHHHSKTVESTDYQSISNYHKKINSPKITLINFNTLITLILYGLSRLIHANIISLFGIALVHNARLSKWAYLTTANMNMSVTDQYYFYGSIIFHDCSYWSI